MVVGENTKSVNERWNSASASVNPFQAANATSHNHGTNVSIQALANRCAAAVNTSPAIS